MRKFGRWTVISEHIVFKNRINNNGNYCKWSTPKEQANNRRNNV